MFLGWGYTHFQSGTVPQVHQRLVHNSKQGPHKFKNNSEPSYVMHPRRSVAWRIWHNLRNIWKRKETLSGNRYKINRQMRWNKRIETLHHPEIKKVYQRSYLEKLSTLSLLIGPLSYNICGIFLQIMGTSKQCWFLGHSPKRLFTLKSSKQRRINFSWEWFVLD